MDILRILADLRQKREQVEEVIMMERLRLGQRRRRGRPPTWMTGVKDTTNHLAPAWQQEQAEARGRPKVLRVKPQATSSYSVRYQSSSAEPEVLLFSRSSHYS